MAKKEAIALLQKPGVQFSGLLPQDGFVHSISENKDLVNTKIMKQTDTPKNRDRVNANKESGLAQRFSNHLGEAIGRVSKAFHSIVERAKSSSKEARALAKLTSDLQAIQDQFDALLERRNAPAAQQKENTSDRGVMKMERSLVENLDEENLSSGLRFKEFINHVNQMVDKAKGSKRKMKLGIVSKKHSALIDQTMKKIYKDFSSEGFKLWTDGTAANHIEKGTVRMEKRTVQCLVKKLRLSCRGLFKMPIRHSSFTKMEK